jgi:signal peptidase I
MNLRWFLSSTVRNAMDVHKHVRRVLMSQKDILPAKAVGEVTVSLNELESAIKQNRPKDELERKMEALEKKALEWLKQYPNAGLRENVEVFLVAIAVAMAIRTFFVQPFKIPTGSMQPTLYGVTVENLKDTGNTNNFSGWRRIVDVAVYGTFYHELIAEQDGTVEAISPPGQKRLGFINVRQIKVSYRSEPYTIWCTPDDDGSHRFEQYAVSPGQSFKKGEPILKFKEVTGDHLFVDRLTYNFRHPRRGDIIVFATKGIHYPEPFPDYMPQDQFYIKRLVGLGGETIGVGKDRHVRINGEALDASTPCFENIYSFTNAVGTDSQYSGHTPMQMLRADLTYNISPKHYFAMGDNTVNSADSRYWGELPQENVIGKPCFIYWPKSPRFGWGYR